MLALCHLHQSANGAARHNVLNRKDLGCHVDVFVDACVDVHSKGPEHDGDEPVSINTQSYIETILSTRPPVEVPAMRSKY